MCSILTIQLLVVCFTLVQWPTTVTAKALTSRQKEKPHGKKQKTYGIKNNLAVGQKENWRLMAKRKTSRQKEKDSKQKENLTAKNKKTHGKISSIARRHFNSYFFCREVMVILFVVRLFFLPWRFSFCREVNSFAVTVVGHRTFEILFPKILDFSTCGYSWELARTLLIWLAFKPQN